MTDGLATPPSRMQGMWRGAALPIVLGALWIVSTRHPAPSSLLPSPENVLNAFLKAIGDGTLITALGISLMRDFGGLLIGSTVGLLIGVLIGINRWSSRLVLPSLDLFKLVSPFAWIPLIMTWLGLGEASKLTFIALVAFLPVVFATVDGMAATPRELVELARVQRLTAVQTLVQIALPSAAPAIFNGVYLALVASWMATLGAEYLLTSGGGIGAALVAARDNFAMPDLIVDMAVVGGVGFLFHRCAQAIETRALHWRRTLAVAVD